MNEQPETDRQQEGRPASGVGPPVDTRSMVGVRGTGDAGNRDGSVPDNRIPVGCEQLTPQMLSLVRLTEDEITRIVAAVPGGAPNVQDVYPLAPLQGGVLFHHLLEGAGDPYLSARLFAFDSRERLDRYVSALRAVVARHDILRTAVLWEGLREPVQVVYRRVQLPVEEVELDPQDGDVAGQLSARFDPRQFRIDLRLAPMLRVYVTQDHGQQRWLLLFLRHHLTGDHASAALMEEEIEAHLLGRAEALPEPLPFRNFVGRLGVSVEDHEAYFGELLADVKEPTAPFALMDVRRDGTGMAQADRAVDPSVARRIREQARRLRVTPSSLCHVAWGLVLARVSGRNDVVFGTVLLGRMQAGEAARRVIGMFINTLPVRVRLGDVQVGAIVRETHRQLSRLLRHEQASLALAQRCSRVPAPAPLFSALLNYRLDINGGDVRPERSPAWDGIRTLSAEHHTNYPLMLSIDDERKGFHLTVEVDSSVDPWRICGYMHQALESLVEALESGSERAARTLPVVPDSEREEVLFQWNATAVAYPQEHCIHELFEAQARRTPAATAVEYAGTALSYAELNGQANRLAHYLRARGVGPDQRVAICVDPGLDMVVALLGVLKAGGACVPLNAAWAADRLRFALEDSAPVALLTRLNRERRMAALADKAAIIDVDAAMVASSGYPATDPDRGDLASSDLAYVIYTDVSAGIPGGVMIEHVNIARLSTASTRCCEFTESDVWALLHSSESVVSLWEMWGALLCGGRLIVVAPDVSASPDATYQLLCEAGVTILYQHAAELRRLLSSQDTSGRAHQLRHVVVHNEVLPPGLVRRWCEQNDTYETRLLSTFGGAETMGLGLYKALDKTDANRVGGTSTRMRVFGTRAYVLDGDRVPAPVGVIADVYVGGGAVARGYWRRPELTAERFLPDPFVEHGSARMYRTGDRGKWLPDGTIALVGRTDFHVTIRGFQIELGAVAARLEACDGVMEAVVLATEDTNGERRLVAYYTSAGTQGVTTEALRAQLSATLPGYMVPSAYVQLDALPLTPDGTVNTAALRGLGTAGSAVSEYEAPAGEMEATVARIWAEVLKVERVSRWDNFFELNGHSLLAVQIVARLRQELGVEMALDDLLDQPVLAAFAERLVGLLLEQFDEHDLGSVLKLIREGV